MRVERSAFLFYAAALAAACGSNKEPAADPTIVAIPVQPSSAPAQTSAPVASAEVPAPSEEGGPRTRRPPVRPSPVDESGLASPVDEGVVDSSSCRAKPVPRPSGAECADDRGTPGDCRRANCGLRFVCDQCEAYKRYFKPKVAERAVACVVGQKASQARDGCRTYQCGDEALRKACIDPTADAACGNIAKKCKATMGECRDMLSGMNAAGRAKITACANQGCQFGLWSCIEGI